MNIATDDRETARTRARYNRLATMYDAREGMMEKSFGPRRRRLWSLVPEGRVLEVGIGTGKNIPYHPAAADVTGIDLSDRMLHRAREKAHTLNRPIELREMDVQQLEFPDASFDAAVATFVFCSVPDPVRGLREMARVVRPGGPIYLLEHVRIDRPSLVGKVMDVVDPLVVRLMGPHINRRTVENVRRAGLGIERVETDGPAGMIKLIVARAPNGSVDTTVAIGKHKNR